MTKEPEIGTLAELNVKPGDVVQCLELSISANVHYLKAGKQYSIVRGKKGACFIDEEGDECFGHLNIFQIVSRASQPDPETPTLWKDMTPGEKGALLLAHHEGKTIEWTRSPGDADYRQSTAHNLRPVWSDNHAYRIRPSKPKRMTVDLMADFKRIGTIDLIDGKPDPASIRMEEPD